jgi:uncharacterized protein YacL
MLYTASIMNNKPNIPDEIDFRKKDYSFRADMKVNGWMFVALIISVGSDVLFSDEIKTWQLVWRVIIAIAPFLAILVWVRDLTRWVRGMDELHRRITLTTIVFAVSTTLFVVALWHLLAKAGIWQTFFRNFFDPNSVWVILSLMMAFYFHGYRIFNSRYK